MLTDIDGDGDGVSDTCDNCKTTPNADQHNCDYAYDVSLGDPNSNLLGDACDPDPCIYYQGTTSINHAAGPAAYNKNMALRVDYRAVGYTAGQGYKHQNMDAYSCACQDVNGQLIDPEICKQLHCKDDSVVSTNRRTDEGWHRLIWSAHADALTPPFDIGKDSCPLVDLDGEVPPVYNDCNTPLQSRLFRRPFFDTPDLGHAVADWEAYWTDTANHRTRAFEWDWRNQDYPHPDGTRYEPPTDHARVRLWLRPEGFIFDLYPIPTHFSDVMNIEAALIPRVWALLTNYDIEYLFPTSPLVPDNPLGPFGPVGPVGPVFVHPLAWGHGGAEVEPYLWADPPEDAATAGLLVKRFNPVNGEIYDPVTHEEQDLECLPLTVGKSSAIEYLTLGSTGIAAQLSVTSIAPYAWFHSFSDASFSEVSASAAWFTHMSGPRLVWAEAMAQSQIVLYDTVTKVKTVLDPQPHGQWLPRIDGDRIVWVDHRNAPGDMVNQGNSDIYLHDLSSGKSTPVTINAARQDHPDVDGDWVVWEDWRNNPNPTPRYSGEFKESDIFALNLKTGKEIQVTNLPGMELNPKVDGDRVFYIKGPLIFMKNLR